MDCPLSAKGGRNVSAAFRVGLDLYANVRLPPHRAQPHEPRRFVQRSDAISTTLYDKLARLTSRWARIRPHHTTGRARCWQVDVDGIGRGTSRPALGIGANVIAISAPRENVFVFPARHLHRIDEADLSKIVATIHVVTCGSGRFRPS
jgi:hypothetical protein